MDPSRALFARTRKILRLHALGTALAMLAVLRIETFYDRVLIAVLGLMLMQVGIWQLTSSLLPNQREYRPLRNETDYFLSLPRTWSHRPPPPPPQLSIRRSYSRTTRTSSGSTTELPRSRVDSSRGSSPCSPAWTTCPPPR